jgi:eukaryotic-like serine/threonine-protein kinase
MLYEMVTGRQAFHGDSKLSTLFAILKDDPKPVSAVAADVPRDLDKLIIRCLRKDPDRRYQSMADLKVALQELKEESDSGKLTSIASAVMPGGRRSRRMWTLAGTAVLLIVAAVGIWLLRPRSHPVPKTVPLTSYPNSQVTPAFSPDGKQVAFAWDGEQGGSFDIYIKLVDAGSPLRLTTNPANEYGPTWSPDGRYIAFCRDLGERLEIWMIPALGGSERKLGEKAAEIYPGANSSFLSWSPDGKFLAFGDKPSPEASLGLYILSLQTGEKRRLTSPPPQSMGDYSPHFSPDGKTLAFIRERSGTAEIYSLAISENGNARSEPQRLTPRHSWIGGFDWTPDGRSIVFSPEQFGSISLWISSAAGGTPERLIGGENARDVSISRAGDRLVYVRTSLDSNIWRIAGPNALHKDTAPTLLIASTQRDQEAQFSPDGKKIVFSSDRSGTSAIWVCDRDGLNAVELASDASTLGSPRWSWDSRWIAFDSPKAGNVDIYVISADGGPVRRLTAGPSNNIRPSWSKDGRWIYFGSNRSGD